MNWQIVSVLIAALGLSLTSLIYIIKLTKTVALLNQTMESLFLFCPVFNPDARCVRKESVNER